ncbi:hypothetical protein ACFL6H_08630 [Candidatus Latescibacterota bacterium]
MKKLLLVLIVMISIFALHLNMVNAQVLSPVSAGEQSVYFNLGLEPSVGTTMGYVLGKHIGLLNRDMMLFGEFNIPVTKFDLGDSQIRFGAQTSLLRHRKWDFSLGVAIAARKTKNSIFDAYGFGADITGLIGYYSNRWSVAGEIGYDKAMITHLTHSDWYKTYFYSDAKNGWYANTGGTFHYGLRGGFMIGRTEITLRAGIQKTEAFRDMLPPYYGSLGVNYRF